MRTILISSALLLSTCATAQTYYYINSIGVSPASPTTADAITITVYGDLSNTAAEVVNASYMMDGNTVEITIHAAQQGIGLDVLTPHSESFTIGTLAAGTYTVNITGTSILDSAPPPEHQFTVTGGGATECDSLDIISILWDAFSTERLIVTAANASSDLFDYPGFVILDTQGDTIAKETVNYFGIGTNPQQHVLDVVDWTLIDGNTINGQLHLWSDFYSVPECEFEGSWELCPTTECTMIVPYLVNLGNAIAEADIPYTITNGDGDPMTSGTFHLSGTAQSDYEPGVCLPPDYYTLYLQAITPVGGQLYHGVSADVMNWQAMQEFYVQGVDNSMFFPLFGPCIFNGNGVEDHSNATGLELRQDADHLFAMAPAGTIIGHYEVLDAQGRIMLAGNTKADRAQLSLVGLSPAAYIFRSEYHRAIRFVH